MFLLHEMAYQNASFLISEGPKFALFLHINTLLVHDAMKYIKYDLDVQRGQKLILDGGTQLNNKNLIFAKISPFSIFYSIKSPKDGGTPQFRPPCL